MARNRLQVFHSRLVIDITQLFQCRPAGRGRRESAFPFRAALNPLCPQFLMGHVEIIVAELSTATGADGVVLGWLAELIAAAHWTEFIHLLGVNHFPVIERKGPGVTVLH